MDNIRQQIIQQLDKPITYRYHENTGLPDYRDNYYWLKSSLNMDYNYTDIGDYIDLWFKGVIHSLYYRPNKYVLVLEGKQAIGKTTFFEYLFPREHTGYCPHYCTASEMSCLNGLIYEFPLVNIEFTKKNLNIPLEENFVIEPFCGTSDVPGVRRYASTNKRLASYCSTTNKWMYPPRKNFIILKVEYINQELFNSIDKLQLWIEIFNKFKPQSK